MKVSVHIISIIFVVTVYLSGCGKRQSADRACIAELKQIDGAIHIWALDNKKGSNDLVTWADLVGPNRYLLVIPRCPRGGSYTITRVGVLPACSIPEDDAYFKANR